MLKQVFLAFLLAALAGAGAFGLANDKTSARLAPKLNPKEAALVDDTQAWADRADFWKIVARGEALAERIEVITVKTNSIEAWVCGPGKVCVSTRLLREFSAEAQKAVIAHEIGHMLIPRNYEAHPQLWEAQCDLFAAMLLRDAQQVKQMLSSLVADCASCSDQLHPKPTTRLMLVERFAVPVLAKVSKFDEFRGRSYAVQFKMNSSVRLAAFRHLSFAVRCEAFPARQPAAPAKHTALDELKRLNFAVRISAPPQAPQKRRP